MEPRAVTGVVAIVDALGASKFDIRKSLQFVKNRDVSINDLSAIFNEYSKWIEDFAPEDRAGLLPLVDKDNPRIYTFGDSIILTWESSLTPYKQLAVAGSWLYLLLLHALKNGILFRGAVSFGSFVTDDCNTVLGPAVADAVYWYELPQLMTIIVTRKSENFVVELNSANDIFSDQFAHFFLKYPTQVKDKSEERKVVCGEMWNIAWPCGWIQARERGFAEFGIQNPRELVAYLLDIIKRDTEAPKSAWMKYDNTLRFYDWCDNSQQCKSLLEDIQRLQGNDTR